MNHRSLLAVASLTLLSTAACGSSPADTSSGGGGVGGGSGGAAQNGGGGPGGAGTGGGVPVIPEAVSKLPREQASQIPHASLAAAVTANNDFAVDLYGHLRSGQGSNNLLTSPISASLALTMTYAGARGATATQMAKAMHFGASDTAIFEGQNALTQALDKRAATAFAEDKMNAMLDNQKAPLESDYQLQVVNSVWGEKTYTWEKPFLDILAKDYGTGVYLEDFLNEPEPTRQAINGWVSAKTADKINDLLPKGSLDSALMVLVNAIHLRLHWVNAFMPSATTSAAFTKTDGSSVGTPFMHQTESFPYVDDGNAQVIGLPLAGGQLSVIIALPHGDLATYEDALTSGSAALSQPTAYAQVDLSLPKVTFTSNTFSLKPSLMDMGMTDAFADTADLSGLCTAKPLFIENVLQKTMIAMEEKGVEAAAATAVIVGSSGAAGGGPPPTVMKVNHPYVMAIVDVPTGAVLFLGHIADPSS